ncbi:MAG: CRISPR-associated CARF protein Csa3 [Ignisphaera sp.]|nr:CRISPR-associated CARF protein Csa3 [Ignisphaera sp.]
MAVYVFTLGFHADHVIRRLSRARDVDGVYVFTGRPAVRAVYNAFQEIAAFCEKASLPTPKLYELSIEDSGAAVYTIVSLLKDAGHIVADVGGGLRGLVAITVSALFILSRWSSIDLYVYGEREDAPETHIPIPALYQIVTKGFSEEKIKILEILNGVDEMDIGSIAGIIGRSERTVRAHLSELKRVCVVVSTSGGKLALTSWGRIVVALSKI